MKKLLSILTVLAVLFLLPLEARATEGTGSIRVTLKRGGGEVTLYRVGDNVEAGYRLEEAWGGGFIKEEDAASAALAAWLAETQGEGGSPLLLDADRSALYSDLPQGLYLMVQSEFDAAYHPFQPFLVSIPTEEHWHITAQPKTEALERKSPPTGESPMLVLAVGMMALSAVGLGICFAGRRRYF